MFNFCDCKGNCIFYFLVILESFDRFVVVVVEKFVNDGMVIDLKNDKSLILLMLVYE